MNNITSINSDDHIVKIQPSEDVVLAMNPVTGEELCKLEFEAGGKKIRFNTPMNDRWAVYVTKLIELFTYLSQHAGELSMTKEGEEFPDLIKLFKDPDHNPIWRKLSAEAISSRPRVMELVLEIFFNYLDGYIVGVEPVYPEYKRVKLFKKAPLTDDEKRNIFIAEQKRWFLKNVRIDQTQRVFSACLAVRDMVKKNAIFMLEREIQSSHQCMGLSSETTFATKQASTPKDSEATQSYSFSPL